MKNEIKTLQAEINEFNAKREAAKKENVVKDDFPKLTRKFTYRKSTVIKPSDLRL